MAKQFEKKDNSGVLFKNDKKTTENHPDYKGDAMIEGVEFWMSAWIKTAGSQSKAAGQKFMSFSFQPKEDDEGDNRQSSNVRREQPKTDTAEIPFIWLVPFIGLLAGSGLLS